MNTALSSAENRPGGKFMNVTDFAESILFADRLEDKLAPPDGEVLFESAHKSVSPDSPGRPVELCFGREGKTELPSRPELVNDERRGELLHFFANHELLATELMALALLKFPDAPVAFRRGLLKTLLEEQRHTKWYMSRMQQCGITFGDLPVSRYFWDAVAPMESPLDYVTRLSLTFEQANLDYSRHFARIMKEAGDEKTSAILEQIYKDEIAHVGYGLKWFRKWKKEGESDWNAFGRALRFPLSPSRAKGNIADFNVEGRKKAGLGDDFIAELEIFERSKGRTPDVFYFNPMAEEEIAKGGRIESSGTVQDLEKDLEILVAFLARREDVSLLRRIPSRDHLARLKNAGFILPELAELDRNGGIPDDSLLRERRLHRFCPWGHSPATADILGPLSSLRPESTRDAPLWRDEWARLMSKPPVTDGEPRFAATICTCIGEAETAVRELENSGIGNGFVAKAPLGSSGRRNQRFDDLKEAASWVEKTIKRQGYVIIEPWVNRVFDFSAHYEMEEAGLRFLGFVRLENDRRGQFSAAEAGPKFLRTVDPGVARFLMEKTGDSGLSRLSCYKEDISESLGAVLASARYRGPVGIDAFVHQKKNGELALRSVVEINCRYTMGRVAIELSRMIDTSKTARLELVQKESLDLSKNPESNCTGTPPRLTDGRIFLNDPAHARRVIAVLSVGGT